MGEYSIVGAMARSNQARYCVAPQCSAIRRANIPPPNPVCTQARYGRGPPAGSSYSGVLECPCNSNFGGDPIFYPEAKTKVIVHSFSALSSGTCQPGEKVATTSKPVGPH